jgi:hypothetical protein
MRKRFSALVPAKPLALTALCAIVGACSDASEPVMTAPTAPIAVAASRAPSHDPNDGSAPIAVFVIGDNQANDVGATVNFWGAQWWKNNQMSDTVSNGVASFKGYATTARNICGGTWESRPGNSYDPPSAIDADIAVVVTSTVVKDGAVIHGSIKRIVMVHHDGGYGPNPGHPGNGVVTSIVCEDGGGVAT